MGKPIAALPTLLVAALFVLTVAGPATGQVFIANVPAALQGKQPAAAPELVARSADEVERELGGADAF